MSFVLPVQHNSGPPLLLRFPVNKKLEGTVNSDSELEEKLKQFIREQFAEIRQQIESPPAPNVKSKSPTFDYKQLDYTIIINGLKKSITAEITAYLSNPTNFTTIINQNRKELNRIIQEEFTSLSRQLSDLIKELRTDHTALDDRVKILEALKAKIPQIDELTELINMIQKDQSIIDDIRFLSSASFKQLRATLESNVRIQGELELVRRSQGAFLERVEALERHTGMTK